MGNQPIRVGIVGVNTNKGWARNAHLPALAELPDFVVTAVATTKQESAEAAAAQFGVPHAFVGAQALAEQPDVDLVVVTVKVPSHADAVRAALAARKHVYSEWPLAVDLAEANELAELAHQAGVFHAVGLQGTHSPSARFVRELVTGGKLGELRSVDFMTASGPGGARVTADRIWSVDPKAGVGALRIRGGHSLATLATALGEPIVEFSSVAPILDTEVAVTDTGARLPNNVPSQVALAGTLSSGAAVSFTVQGGVPTSAPQFSLSIVGTNGVLTITPLKPGDGAFHYSRWKILLSTLDGPPEELTVPDRFRTAPASVPAGPPTNVAELYQELAAAIHEGRQPEPNFDTAVANHRLLETIEAAAQSGTRERVETSPRAALVP